MSAILRSLFVLAIASLDKSFFFQAADDPRGSPCARSLARPRFIKTVFCGCGVLASGGAERLELNTTNVTVCLSVPSILSEVTEKLNGQKLAIDVGAGEEVIQPVEHFPTSSLTARRFVTNTDFRTSTPRRHLPLPSAGEGETFPGIISSRTSTLGTLSLSWGPN
jgi:hypothetical protein